MPCPDCKSGCIERTDTSDALDDLQHFTCNDCRCEWEEQHVVKVTKHGKCEAIDCAECPNPCSSPKTEEAS